jgi:hypothetical protein
MLENPRVAMPTTAATEEGGKRPDRRDVEAIWQQLNASRPSNKQSFDRLWHGFSSDVSRPNKPCSSSSQDTIKKSQQLKLDPFIGKFAAAGIKTNSIEHHSKHETATGLEGAALDRLVQALQSPDASVRKAALHQVQVSFAQPVQLLHRSQDHHCCTFTMKHQQQCESTLVAGIRCPHASSSKPACTHASLCRPLT